MATIKFTETRIERLRHDPKGPRVQPEWDSEIKGLGVYLYDTGKKSYCFQYRIHGRKLAMVLAPTNELSLKDARDTAIGYRALVKSGTDPKAIWDAPAKEGAARGLLNRIRILLNYALQEDVIEHSPADRIKPKYTSSGKRTAWLDSDEKLREAWWFTGPPQARALIRWALLTGCRCDEARTTRYSWITDQTWKVSNTKNSRELVLPLMPAMRQVVDEMRSTFGATKWLFPATTTTRKAIPAGTLDYQIRFGAKKEWSLHTLRRTVETYQ